MSHRQTIYFNEKHFTYYSLDGGKRLTYHVHGSYPLGSKLLMTVMEQDATTTLVYDDFKLLEKCPAANNQRRRLNNADNKSEHHFIQHHFMLPPFKCVLYFVSFNFCARINIIPRRFRCESFIIQLK